MKFILFILSFVVLFFSFTSPTFAEANTIPQKVEQRLEAVVESVKEEKNLSDGGVKRKYQKLELIITDASQVGKKIIVENGKVPVISTVEYRKGDKVVVSVTKSPQGKDTYFVTDYVRRDSLYLLFGIFVILTVIIGGVRGVASLGGMVLTIVIIFFVVLPQILQGHDPITVAILSSIVIIPITFYLSHGMNKKTNCAILGTIFSLLITGLLANYFVHVSHLSGFSSEDSTFLEAAKSGVVPMQGLLLAGIIIGALGVLDDITISQSAIVFELKKTSPLLGIWELFKKGMDIGRDHIASMVNTLVLVYTGAALPLLLLFTNNPLPFTQIINYEMLAEEIVRTFVVSIGLILAVPLVTFIAAVTCEIEIKQAAKEIMRSLK